jgi:hypothetical protein
VSFVFNPSVPSTSCRAHISCGIVNYGCLVIFLSLIIPLCTFFFFILRKKCHKESVSYRVVEGTVVCQLFSFTCVSFCMPGCLLLNKNHVRLMGK